MKLITSAVVALAVLAAFVCIPVKATAADTSAVMTAINGAVTSFNKGDEKAWEAHCTSPASIISNIAPFQYQGATACSDWWSAHAASSKKNGVSGETVVLGKASSLLTSGDRAYAAFPASYTYVQNHKTIKTSGILTIALQKTASGWLMTGWSWASH